MASRITVVISQGQSPNPRKRAIEEEIVGRLLGSKGIDVTVIPHLYDLREDSSGMLCLSGMTGDLIVCSWLFPRAARWTLDRHGIRGQEGTTLIRPLGADDDEEDEQSGNDADEDGKLRVLDQRQLPERRIYCLDLRSHDSADPYVEEIRRIANEASQPTVQLMDWIGGSPDPAQLNRYMNADNGVGGETPAAGNGNSETSENGTPATIVDETATRRWYPVIDFGRCTNCLECIDFCLFGVYGIDAAETILVEQPDNCRKGCPACSRVCPENAIIFPQHKTPTIAGSPEVGGSMKIDLSKLFGAPDPGAPGNDKAVDVAVRERDEQLLLAGRNTVGNADRDSQA